MANRPVFLPTANPEHLVEKVSVEFPWHPGFAFSQKQKNAAALHKAAAEKGLSPLLEVSTKSGEELGTTLSAFNLTIETEIGEISLEAAYQGSKVFAGGGRCTDIYKMDARSAKRDSRVRAARELRAFKFFDEEWPINPSNAFYDWLYLSSLQSRTDLHEQLCNYRGFTDIEFNPGKSINCQARACALLVSLLKLNMFDDAMQSQESFLAIMHKSDATLLTPQTA